MSSFFSWIGSRNGNRIGNQENIPESTQKKEYYHSSRSSKIASSSKNYEPLRVDDIGTFQLYKSKKGIYF
jgi:hypothetical protein